MVGEAVAAAAASAVGAWAGVLGDPAVVGEFLLVASLVGLAGWRMLFASLIPGFSRAGTDGTDAVVTGFESGNEVGTGAGEAAEIGAPDGLPKVAVVPSVSVDDDEVAIRGRF